MTAAWHQVYTPLSGSLALSALAAGCPVFIVLIALGVFRAPAWKASLAGLVAAAVCATAVFGMPVRLMLASAGYGAAFGIFPIAWIVYWALVLHRVTVETGKFEIIRESVGGLTSDPNLQALIIAFAFGAFLEGAAGFGAPVAVAAAMLTGLGFKPFQAAALCLLANTAPVAFGSIAIPLVTLAGATGLPLPRLSADTGLIITPVALFIPVYLMAVAGGWKAVRQMLPGAAVCGIAFAGTQLLVSVFIGPALTDILASLAAMGALMVLLRFWHPAGLQSAPPERSHTSRDVLLAWTPYALLVILILLWGMDFAKPWLGRATGIFAWPGLHNSVLRMPPAVLKMTPYPALYTFNFLATSGSACMAAAVLSALMLRVSPMRFCRLLAATGRQMAVSLATFAAVLALAFLMNYSGATATLGLAFAATGAAFPFFSPLLGWLGVFLTGSDTSSNALFGSLQVVTAGRLGLNAALMASSNSAGGVMGKMISLQSIAVAAAATGLPPEDESRLFRFTLRHSILLASVIGLIVLFFSYAAPGWVR